MEPTVVNLEIKTIKNEFENLFNKKIINNKSKEDAAIKYVNDNSTNSIEKITINESILKEILRSLPNNSTTEQLLIFTTEISSLPPILEYPILEYLVIY